MHRHEASTVNPVRAPKTANYGAITVQFLCKAKDSGAEINASQTIERSFHFLPELFQRLASHGHAHKSFRNFVAPARASFRRCVQTSKTRGRANHSAIIDESLSGSFVAQRHTQNHSEP